MRRLGRAVAALALVVLVALLSSPWWVAALGGASERRAVADLDALTPAARGLLQRVWQGVDPARRLDVHTHLAGRGAGSSCWVNPRLQSWLSPKDHVRFLMYLSAAAVRADDQDAVYVERLVELVRARPRPSRHLLLAFDHRYDERGELDLEHSEFHVPNDYVWEVAQRSPELFVPCVSIHPYRRDALEELARWTERGVRFVKWLPNAMGIDPASARCFDFYDALRERGVVLLSHTGAEQAVDAAADQELGNPLRLRAALERGVRVIAAHCATSGRSLDLDRGGSAPSFELFLRMMDEARYEGLLFGEISTLTQINRYRNGLAALLERGDLHARLVDGSDWPLPGINVLYSTRLLARAGFLDRDDVPALVELYDYNPLVFDFALKRCVRSPRTGARFAASAFELPEELGVVENGR